MTNITEFPIQRVKYNQPDPDCVRHDDFGKPLYSFHLSYKFDGGEWGLELWAYSMEDAQAKVAAMRETLVCDGQVFGVVPA